jgi:hypothetical protein
MVGPEVLTALLEQTSNRHEFNANAEDRVLLGHYPVSRELPPQWVVSALPARRVERDAVPGLLVSACTGYSATWRPLSDECDFSVCKKNAVGL